jgi:hypothetical protein
MNPLSGEASDRIKSGVKGPSKGEKVGFKKSK